MLARAPSTATTASRASARRSGLVLPRLSSPSGRRPMAVVAAAGTSQASRVVVRKPTAEEAANAKKNWPTWGCGAETFPWTYSEREQCLVLEGEVVVTPTSPPGEPVKIVAGDYAVFPQGMSCTWAVSKPIKKHYNFG